MIDTRLVDHRQCTKLTPHSDYRRAILGGLGQLWRSYIVPPTAHKVGKLVFARSVAIEHWAVEWRGLLNKGAQPWGCLGVSSISGVAGQICRIPWASSPSPHRGWFTPFAPHLVSLTTYDTRYIPPIQLRSSMRFQNTKPNRHSLQLQYSEAPRSHRSLSIACSASGPIANSNVEYINTERLHIDFATEASGLRGIFDIPGCPGAQCRKYRYPSKG
ncbi:hypothetical protein B0H17DRAFT_1127184 [Mycena rosella]|uniref:Uncharacterized protein n=1 Tax=Mycena rosella TaxID=1033263 RepID=A0AAD7DZT0_MYCRO|nr:hypothetical protein B0H17DRAFT_1127184 [Mycena rosella]